MDTSSRYATWSWMPQFLSADYTKRFISANENVIVSGWERTVRTRQNSLLACSEPARAYFFNAFSTGLIFWHPWNWSEPWTGGFTPINCPWLTNNTYCASIDWPHIPLVGDWWSEETNVFMQGECIAVSFVSLPSSPIVRSHTRSFSKERKKQHTNGIWEWFPLAYWTHLCMQKNRRRASPSISQRSPPLIECDFKRSWLRRKN